MRVIVIMFSVVALLYGGRVNQETQGMQLFPKIARIGNDEYIVVWEDTRNGSVEIYAQKIDGNGNPQWNEDKVLSQGSEPSYQGFIGHRMVSRLVGSGNQGIVGYVNYADVTETYKKRGICQRD